MEEIEGIPLAAMGITTRIALEFWAALRGDRPAPAWRDFDICDFGAAHPGVVPNLWVLDVERDPYRFRFRLIGGAIIEAGGFKEVGRHVDDHDPTGENQARFVAGCETLRPSFRRYPPLYQHAKFVKEIENVYLPMLGEDGRVARFLNCTAFHWDEGYGQEGAQVSFGPTDRGASSGVDQGRDHPEHIVAPQGRI